MKLKLTLYERFEDRLVPIFEREIEHDSAEARAGIIEYNKRTFAYQPSTADIENRRVRYNEVRMITLMPKDGKVLV